MLNKIVFSLSTSFNLPYLFFVAFTKQSSNSLDDAAITNLESNEYSPLSPYTKAPASRHKRMPGAISHLFLMYRILFLLTFCCLLINNESRAAFATILPHSILMHRYHPHTCQISRILSDYLYTNPCRT